MRTIAPLPLVSRRQRKVTRGVLVGYSAKGKAPCRWTARLIGCHWGLCYCVRVLLWVIVCDCGLCIIVCECYCGLLCVIVGCVLLWASVIVGYFVSLWIGCYCGLGVIVDWMGVSAGVLVLECSVTNAEKNI